MTIVMVMIVTLDFHVPKKPKFAHVMLVTLVNADIACNKTRKEKRIKPILIIKILFRMLKKTSNEQLLKPKFLSRASRPNE